MFGQEDVGLAVEQQQDRSGVEPTGSLLLPQGQAGSPTAHIADLKVEDHKAGIDHLGCGNHVGAGSHSVDDMRARDSGLDFIENPVGISGQK